MHRLYFWLANVIFVGHFLLGLFFLTGWYFAELELLYFVVMLGWALSWIVLGFCPVSYWEFWLRNKYDETIHPNTDIIQHYLKSFFNISVTKTFVFNVGMIVFSCLMSLSFVY